MATSRGGRILMGGMAWRWCVFAVLLGGSRAATLSNPVDDPDNTLSSTPSTKEQDENFLKQVVWKRCYRKITPACLKLNLVRTVELMSKDSSLALIPGVFFSSNTSEFNALPPEIARSLSSEHAPLDDLVSFTVGKYLRSLTLNVNIVDFVSGGNETLQRSVIDAFSGRARKNGLMGGYGAIAAMMGGMMASMMMAALAALAGKAMMTSLLALMMAAFAAMKGGGGGGSSKTYEVITKPVVSHIDTHSSEVQHEHHGHYHKRSLEVGGSVQRHRPLKEERVARLGEGAEGNMKHLEFDEFKDRKKSSNDTEYSLMKNVNGNDGNNNKNDFDDAKIQIDSRQWGSIDVNENFYAKNLNSSETQSSDKGFQRFKRGLGHSSTSESTKLLSVVVPKHSDTTNTHIPEHPRQNHKEYRRNTDDDLLMAFGLFR